MKHMFRCNLVASIRVQIKYAALKFLSIYTDMVNKGIHNEMNVIFEEKK